jgi:mercuric reductase
MATLLTTTEHLELPAGSVTGGPAKQGGKDVLQVLNHLESLLPLPRRHRELQPGLRSIHRIILRSLADTGKPPSQSGIAAMLGGKAAALESLGALQAVDLVVLSAPAIYNEKTKQTVADPAAEIVGAYPMTTAATPHKVTSNGQVVNAMCAVDALAISPMFSRETVIESKCHLTGTPIRIRQNGATALEARPNAEIRVGIRWQSLQGCAAKTICAEMVFLKDAQTAETWRKTDPQSIDILTLEEAIELGTAFFVPLLEE